MSKLYLDLPSVVKTMEDFAHFGLVDDDEWLILIVMNNNSKKKAWVTESFMVMVFEEFFMVLCECVYGI